MFSVVPRAPLLLGLAGLLPFIWGFLTYQFPAIGEATVIAVGGRFSAPFIQLSYGTIILSFMSGVLWGFATRDTGWSSYFLSVIPALWAFFMVGSGPTSSALYLCVGFIGLLLLDLHFWQRDLTPHWWMALRLLLTTIVVISLLPLAFG